MVAREDLAFRGLQVPKLKLEFWKQHDRLGFFGMKDAGGDTDEHV